MKTQYVVSKAKTLVRGMVSTAAFSFSCLLYAAEPATFTINIPQQSMGSALLELAEKSGTQIVLSEDVRDLQNTLTAPAVSGQYTLSTALEQMLRNSGLAYESVSDDTVVIKKAAVKDSDDDVAVNQARPVIEEVIVTAQKREQSLQDVPISITVMGEEELRKKGIDNFDGLKYAAPGIGLIEQGPTQKLVFLRGAANLTGSEPLTSFYIDDASANTGGNPGSFAEVSQMFPLEFTDLARVEVLHGPQGTLYGAGAVGGTIRYITNDPVLDRFGARGDVSVSFTQDGAPSQRATAVANLPLVEDKFGIRIASTFDKSGGFIDMPVQDREDVNNQDLQQIRVKALWRPSDRLDMRAMVIVHRNEGDVGSTIGDEDLNLVIPPSDMIAEALPLHDDAEHYNLTMDYDAGFARLLSSSTYVRRDLSTLSRLNITDDRNSLLGFTNLNRTDIRTKLFSQEIRATSADAASPLSWTVGSFYQDATRQFLDQRGVSTFNGVSVPYAFPGNEGKTQSWAVFADTSYTFFNRLELGAGIRYFDDEQDFLEFTTEQADSAKFDATTWRAYASYDMTDAVKAYANIGTGFRSGGVNLSPVAQNFFGVQGVPGYGPETLTSYEAGAKMSLLDGRLNADIALFYSEYDDILHFKTFQDGILFFSIIENVGVAEVKGVDAHLDWQVTDRFSFYFNGAITDGEMTVVPDSVASTVVGDPLSGVPEYTFSVGAEHQFDWRADVPGFMRVDYNQRGESHYISRNTLPSPFFSPSDVLGFLSMRIGAEWNRWAFELFGDNLTNENGSINSPIWGRTPRPRPRTIGVRIGVDLF